MQLLLMQFSIQSIEKKKKIAILQFHTALARFTILLYEPNNENVVPAFFVVHRV